MHKNKKATLQDIANECGISTSAVSKILSHQPGFREETRQMVQEAVKKLNYQPNIMARSVVKKEASPIIGVFIPNVHNPFFAELVDEMEKYITKNEYILMLCLYNDDAHKLDESLKMMESFCVSGAIIACFHQEKGENRFLFNHDYMPLVSVQSDIEGIDRVDTTDKAGTKEIIQYLIDNGHTKIGFIGYQYYLSILAARRQGYMEALQDNNIPIREAYIQEGEHSKESGYQMVNHLLDLPEPPTAIHCFNELMVEGAVSAIRDRGLRIPQDISLTGFDNTIISQLTTPQITTIDNPVSLLAEISVQMILERINNQVMGSKARQIYVPHHFIKRNSVQKIATKNKTIV